MTVAVDAHFYMYTVAKLRLSSTNRDINTHIIHKYKNIKCSLNYVLILFIIEY